MHVTGRKSAGEQFIGSRPSGKFGGHQSAFLDRSASPCRLSFTSSSVDCRFQFRDNGIFVVQSFCAALYQLIIMSSGDGTNFVVVGGVTRLARMPEKKLVALLHSFWLYKYSQSFLVSIVGCSSARGVPRAQPLLKVGHVPSC